MQNEDCRDYRKMAAWEKQEKVGGQGIEEAVGRGIENYLGFARVVLSPWVKEILRRMRKHSFLTHGITKTQRHM